MVPPVELSPVEKSTSKVGFAAIQELARLQEEALRREEVAQDLNFLRFDPGANCLRLEGFDFNPKSPLGKFPVEDEDEEMKKDEDEQTVSPKRFGSVRSD